MASSDFGGNGLGMRNGHAKLTRTIAKEKERAPTRKGRAREGADVHAEGVAPSRPSPEAAHKTAKKRAGRGVRVERRLTSPGTNPLDAVVYERRSSTITNPDGSIVFKMEGRRGPRELEPARDRHPHLEVLPQGRPPRRQGHGRDERPAGGPSPRAHDPHARASRYFATKADADTFEAELSYLLVNQFGAFNSPVWFNLGLWHEYGIPGSGGNWAWDERGGDGRRDEDGLRAPAVLGLLHPVGQGRPDVDLRPREVRGAPLQVRLGHRLELQRHPRQAREALGRRHVVGPHVVPRGVRPRGRRDQERRHDAARREDGVPRHGPPGDLRLHRVEGARGEEGARAHRRGLQLATSTARRTTRSAGRTRTTAFA